MRSICWLLVLSSILSFSCHSAGNALTSLSVDAKLFALTAKSISALPFNSSKKQPLIIVHPPGRKLNGSYSKVISPGSIRDWLMQPPVSSNSIFHETVEW
ncbi:MAG: hypothetical protein KGO82_03830 [Bacteroidota bacterium]|nr:hypothetical protein [Bacteroidota bacterium]